MQFVKAHTGQPFFLYLPLTIPHANNEAKGKGMEVPSLGDYAAKDWPAPQKAHAAMISHMDRDIGRLFLQLQTLRIEEDTIVFFTSDNGPHKEGGTIRNSTIPTGRCEASSVRCTRVAFAFP